jgi:competence protein ComEC
MFIKGKGFYLALPLLVVVLAKMLHPILYVFLIFYFIFLYLKHFKILLSVSLLLSFLLFLFFYLPQPLNQNEISGKVVSKDDQSIVVKRGYHKVKVYGEFKNISLFDDISLIGKPYNFHQIQNDYAFNYQYYLYSLNIFDTLQLEKIKSNQHQDHLYHYLEKRIKTSSKVKSLLSLFILGTKDEQMKEYYQKLTQLSIVHLFALSGMHLTILQKWLMNFLKFFFSKKGQKCISLILIGVYMFSIPYNISYLRAYLMLFLPMIFGKWLNQLDIFSFLTVGMLMYNPYLIYFFILLLQNQKAGKYYLFLGSIPIIISIQHVLPVFSFLIGILLMPYIEMIYKSMLYYLLLGKYVLPFLSLEYELLLKMIAFIYDFSFTLPFSQPTLFFIGVYYYLYLKGIYKLNVNRKVTQEVCLLLSVLLAFYFYPYYNMKGQVVMIDVGQGDCFFIQQPYDRGNVLIDTGGLQKSDLATSRLIPYLQSQGVFYLDAVFISHEDYDHCGALASLKEHFKVKKVLYDFKKKKIGDLVFKNLALDKYYTNSNDRSSIIYVTINHLNYLFTGDISKEVESDLYQTYHHLDVDVLKVAHHGSSSSSSEDLFKMIDPKVALISVGKNNRYRHPSYLTLKRLEAYGVKIYRSDLQGMVKIVYYGGKNYIMTSSGF